MATLRLRLGALIVGALLTLGMGACTKSNGPPLAEPSPSFSPPGSAVPAPSLTSPSQSPPVSAAGSPTGHPTKGPIEPADPQDPRGGLTLTGTIHMTGTCVFLDTSSGRWYLGAAPKTLHDGASVTVHGRRVAPPKMCAANQALLVQRVS
jgi:hypothetical protein